MQAGLIMVRDNSLLLLQAMFIASLQCQEFRALLNTCTWFLVP